MIIQTKRRLEVRQKIDNEWWVVWWDSGSLTREEAGQVMSKFKAILPAGHFMLVRVTGTVDAIEEMV